MVGAIRGAGEVTKDSSRRGAHGKPTAATSFTILGLRGTRTKRLEDGLFGAESFRALDKSHPLYTKTTSPEPVAGANKFETGRRRGKTTMEQDLKVERGRGLIMMPPFKITS
ncbi:hypothetical protein HK102_002331 [Quaeritorhiza haematococci]|nr:hypothetical protein HK102_002331 [Quaeritorhiza haematococci]